MKKKKQTVYVLYWDGPYEIDVSVYDSLKKAKEMEKEILKDFEGVCDEESISIYMREVQ